MLLQLFAKNSPKLLSSFFPCHKDSFENPPRLSFAIMMDFFEKPPVIHYRNFFSKTYPSFLTLKEGSTSLSKPLPSQKGKDVPTALLGAQTASLYGWRTIRGLRQQRSCSFFVREWTRLAEKLLMETQGYDEGCSMLIARNLRGLLLMGTQRHK